MSENLLSDGLVFSKAYKVLHEKVQKSSELMTLKSDLKKILILEKHTIFI